jgi:hypothetical protein
MTDVYARVLDGLGNPVGNELLVSNTNMLSGGPSVAALAGGGFAITWTQRAPQRSNGLDVVVRTFDQAGVAMSDVTPVNTFNFGDQYVPFIANLGSQQLIVWSSMGQDGSWEGVFARAFQGANPVGEEFRVNVFTPFSQKLPGIATDGAGRALVFWSGYAVESGFDVFGRNYLVP